MEVLTKANLEHVIYYKFVYVYFYRYGDEAIQTSTYFVLRSQLHEQRIKWHDSFTHLTNFFRGLIVDHQNDIFLRGKTESTYPGQQIVCMAAWPINFRTFIVSFLDISMGWMDDLMSE